MNTTLHSAETYARERKWPVLPLEGKVPVKGSRGYRDATTEIAQIRAWWGEHPDRNVGVVTGMVSGIVVIDVDGPEGERALHEVFGGPPPSTLEARTPHGRHLYYLCPSDGTRVGRRIGLREQLDVLGDRGYVVAPPSVDRETGVAYEWEEANHPIAPLPSPILMALQKHEETEPFRIPDSVDEGARNYTLFVLGAFMANKDAAQETILAALQTENRITCNPPLSTDEVERIARSAGSRRITHPTGGPRFRLLDDQQLLKLPDPNWLIPGYLPEGALAVLYGKPAAGKSFVALDWAMRIATGQAWMGLPVRQGRVLYVVAEGGTSFKLRVQAWHDTFGVQPPTGAFFLLDAVDLMDWDLVKVLLQDIMATMDGAPVMVVFDTLARSMAGGDENKQQDMGAAVAGADLVRRETGAAILLPHHSRRADEEERGSSVLRGAADVMFQVKNEGGALTLNCTKMKDAEPPRRTHLKLLRAGLSCIVGPGGDRALTLEERLLDFIGQNPGCMTTEIRDAVRGKKASIGKQLAALKAAGRLENRGSQGRHKWSLREDE